MTAVPVETRAQAARAQAAREEAVRRKVVGGARRLLADRLVVGTTGNVSGRIGDRMWITPTRTSYERLRPQQLVEVDLPSGETMSTLRPSIELPLHLAVYAGRPDVGAVVHTHSVHATAWSLLGRALEPVTEDLTYYAMGPVVTCTGTAGSTALADVVAGALAGANAVLLAGHGVVTVGDSVTTAIDRAVVIEHVAQIAWLLRNEARHRA